LGEALGYLGERERRTRKRKGRQGERHRSLPYIRSENFFLALLLSFESLRDKKKQNIL
jgi:hypothetical protein